MKVFVYIAIISACNVWCSIDAAEKEAKTAPAVVGESTPAPPADPPILIEMGKTDDAPDQEKQVILEADVDECEGGDKKIRVIRQDDATFARGARTVQLMHEEESGQSAAADGDAGDASVFHSVTSNDDLIKLILQAARH